MLESVLVVLYLVVCGLWGMYAVNMQYAMYPEKTEKSKSAVYVVFILNAIACPIAIFLALVKFDEDIKAIKAEAAREAIKEYVTKERMG